MPSTPAPAAPRVTVLGLGAMGLGMAARLASTFAVSGYDLAAERVQLAADAGVQPADSARAAVAGADVVLLAVRDETQLHEVLFGADGVAEVLARDAVVILTSTVGVDAVAAPAAALADLGVACVDAPVSGGPVRAAAGDLLILVGAAPEVLERVRPVLQRLASTLTVAGDAAGAGQALKTVNQLLCGVHIAAAAEALALAEAMGLDRRTALTALEQGAAASFMLSDRGPRALQAHDPGGAEVRSRLDIFVKDLGIVSRATRAAGLPAPVAGAAEQLFLLGQAHGLGAGDDSSVITVLTRGGPLLQASQDAPGVGGPTGAR